MAKKKKQIRTFSSNTYYKIAFPPLLDIIHRKDFESMNKHEIELASGTMRTRWAGTTCEGNTDSEGTLWVDGEEWYDSILKVGKVIHEEKSPTFRVPSCEYDFLFKKDVVDVECQSIDKADAIKLANAILKYYGEK